ncbi:MAG: hypothetical protein C4K47_08735 [Candidatus Thorarchaeota archaeon]|nr:MAG: hypothetical protein C4K47_08735 [Candidatus Thorarchaeota archaeon]
MNSETDQAIGGMDIELLKCVDGVFVKQVRIVRSDPKDGWAWLRLAGLALRTGPKSETVDAFESVVSEVGDSYLGWFLLGKLEDRLGFWRKAESAYRRAIRLERTDAALWTSLGGVFRSEGRYHAAERALLRAVELNPEYSQAWLDLASVYSELGDSVQCRAALEKAYDSDSLSVAEYVRALERSARAIR